MIEIPEAIVLSNQINQTMQGKRIHRVIAGGSPHKFAWFHEDPAEYDALLHNRMIENAAYYGGRVEIRAEGAILHFGDGVILRYYEKGEPLPAKHQMLVEFDDNSALVCTIAMYGGIWCFNDGEFDNFYYQVAKQSPPPLSDEFSHDYFMRLFNENTIKLSAKAFLATEQRIPGLGNGVVQDILLNAGIHPKRKMNTLDDIQKETLFRSIKLTLSEMVTEGGRDTEKDLFGSPGGYKTKLSKTNAALICPTCGGIVRKETFLGGSIYYCTECQVL